MKCQTHYEIPQGIQRHLLLYLHVQMLLPPMHLILRRSSPYLWLVLCLIHDNVVELCLSCTV